MHESARINYVITPHEIENMQFYLGDDVLLHEVPGGGALLVEKGTPGVPVAVGPDWIRVRFRDGSDGVAFVVTSATAAAGSPYSIATDLPDGGMQALIERKDKKLQVGGQTFQLIYGAHAQLLVRRKDLEKIKDSRIRVKGIKQ